MKRNSDPLALSPHWHVDCRIEAELPEDTVIGTRFIVHVAFTAMTLAAVLFVGYEGFVTLSLRREIGDWEKRIGDNRVQVSDIQRMQREYSAEAVKVDQAHALVQPQLFVTGFLANIGRTRPEPMAIDLIEWNDAGVMIRGSLKERADREKAELLGGYVEQLRRDEKIGPFFRVIDLTSLDRGTTGETLSFEIKFLLKGNTP